MGNNKYADTRSDIVDVNVMIDVAYDATALGATRAVTLAASGRSSTPSPIIHNNIAAITTHILSLQLYSRYPNGNPSTTTIFNTLIANSCSSCTTYANRRNNLSIARYK